MSPAGCGARGLSGWAIASSLFGLLACGADHPKIVGCEDVGAIHAICGVKNAEDLARIPGTSTVVIGQGYGSDAAGQGNIAYFDPVDESVVILYRGGHGNRTPGSAAVWGDPNCPGPPPDVFSPHGIDLAPLSDGRLRLLVVNHGGRESIEFFELVVDKGEPALTWRGCALAPEQAYLNDVANLPDGGFVTTHMMDRGSTFSGTLLGLLGRPTGFVYDWRPGEGFGRVPGTEGALPNGIQVSPDGKTLYLNLYLDGQLRAIDRATGLTLGTLDIPNPDNLTWAGDGHLLVASHFATLGDVWACVRLTEGACGMAFQIVSVDPRTLKAQTIFSHAGPPMGAGTAAVDLDGELLIGSFSSDRLLRAPVSP